MSQIKNRFFLYDGIIFIKKNPQIIFSLVLIVLIPTLFFVSTALILNVVKNALDEDLRQHSVSLSKVIEKYINADLEKPDIIQKKIMELADVSIWLEDVAVFVPSSSIGKYKVIASLNTSSLNKEISSTNNSLALETNQTIATLRKDLNSNETYWLSSSPLHDQNDKIIGILSIALNRARVNNVLNYLSGNLYWFSTVFSLILILFVANHARLFQYAILLMKLRQLDQIKDEFISTTSHELRTPLTTIKGYLSMIQEGTLGQLSDKLKRAIDVTMIEVSRLSNLVEDLLEVSRIEQGRVALEKEPIILNDFIKDICLESQIKASEKSLALNFIDASEKINIATDKNRLKQIIINLINNSIKYTFKGFIEVGLLKEPKNCVSIYVKDTGIGISAQDQEKLFQKFFRVRSEETSQIVGTGLGLWITKKLTELLGGKIYLESIKGQGSKFTLVFPIEKTT